MNYFKLQKRIAILCLILLIITPFTSAYAASIEECGEALASYAQSFAQATTADSSSIKTHYYVDSFDEREYAYKDQQCPSCPHNTFGSNVTDLGMDCVGWVSYAVHHCYGIGNAEFTYFATPQNLACNEAYENVNYSGESSAKIGDILISSHHVMIYVGNGKIVDCANASGQHPGVALRNVPGDVIKIARLKDSAASSITQLVTSYNGVAVNAGGGSESSINYSNFFFNGIPDGKYSVSSRKNIFEIIVDAIKELVGFLIGLIGYMFRGLIIGIISIFDRLLNNTVSSINNSPKTLQESGITATSADDPYSMNRSVTIEGLVFNTMDLFDIDFFK